MAFAMHVRDAARPLSWNPGAAAVVVFDRPFLDSAGKAADATDELRSSVRVR